MNAMQQSIEQKARVIQVVCGALIMGVIFFAAVLSMIADWDPTHFDLTLLSIVGLVIAAGCYAVSVFLPNMMAGNALQVIADQIRNSKRELNSDEGRNLVANQYVTTTIVRYAVIEGAVFANLLFFFVDHAAVCLVVAAIGLALMILFFPFPGRMMTWVQNQISNYSGRLSV